MFSRNHPYHLATAASGALALAMVLIPGGQSEASTISLAGLTPSNGYSQPSGFTTQPQAGVDGTFTPQSSGTTVVTSTGITADLSALSSTDATYMRPWSDNPGDAGTSSADNPPVTIDSAFYENTNAGITFDLSQITPAGELATDLSFIYGYTNADRDTAVSYAAVVDGVLRSSGFLNVPSDGDGATGDGEEYTPQIVVPLTVSDRFITLVASDGNDGIGNDHAIFINPTVTTAVPEPASISLALMSLGGMTLLRRRRRA